MKGRYLVLAWMGATVAGGAIAQPLLRLLLPVVIRPLQDWYFRG